MPLSLHSSHAFYPILRNLARWTRRRLILAVDPIFTPKPFLPELLVFCRPWLYFVVSNKTVTRHVETWTWIRSVHIPRDTSIPRLKLHMHLPSVFYKLRVVFFSSVLLMQLGLHLVESGPDNLSLAVWWDQSAQMSKITNNRLTLSGTGCFIAVPIWRQWAPTVTVVGRSDHVRWLHYSPTSIVLVIVTKQQNTKRCFTDQCTDEL